MGSYILLSVFIISNGYYLLLLCRCYIVIRNDYY